MLRFWQKIALLVLAIAIVSFAASFFFPVEYQICGPNEYTHQKECTKHYLGPFIGLWIVGVLDAHNGLVTAVATIFVAGFTWTLWLTSKNQGILAQQSINLAREEFISTHRPRIKVWNLSFEGNFLEDKPLHVSFRYVNSGDSTAEITGFGSRLIKFKGDLEPGIRFRHQEINPPIEVESGMHGFRLTLDTIDPAALNTLGVLIDNEKIVCLGYVLYQDSNGTRRETGFCRQYSESGRWIVLQDEEYEYDY